MTDHCLLCDDELEDGDLTPNTPLTLCYECWCKLVILSPREVWETVH